MFNVLDLFAGVGGTALGIQRFLNEQNIDFYYTAVENDFEITWSHSLLNPDDSIITQEDAWEYPIFGHDFIWASPPCQSHSRCNMYYNKKNPDMRLWELIRKLQQQDTPFVVENVQPYYTPPINPSLKIGRHYFWSNKPIISFKVPERAKDWGWMGIPDWEKYHGIESRVTDHIKDRMKRRQVLRNMLHPDISYNIIKQILNPKQKQLEVA